MPYIKKEDRKVFDDLVKKLKIDENTPSGELNYLITKILLKATGKKRTYKRLNELKGVLGCCGSEFYRRVIAPYEDEKIFRNGDLPEFNQFE